MCQGLRLAWAPIALICCRKLFFGVVGAAEAQHLGFLELQLFLGTGDQASCAGQLQGRAGHPRPLRRLVPEGEAAGGGQPQDQPAAGLQLVTPLPELVLWLVEPLQGVFEAGLRADRDPGGRP